MTLAGLLTQPCTLYHRTSGVLDEYGDATTSEAPGVATVCELQQLQGQETAQGGPTGRRMELDRLRLFLGPGEELDADDQVEVAGTRYSVDGPPWLVWSPRLRRVDHLEANLRRVS